MKTLIRKKSFYDPEKYGRVQGILEFINELHKGLYTWEEIDKQWPQAISVYNIDYYLAQVNNGGYLQFFLNTGLDQTINNIILKGLKEIKSPKDLVVFQESIKIFENHKEQIESFKETYNHNVFQEFDHLFDQLDFNEDNIFDLNCKYIETINDLHILDEKEYKFELEKILAKVPNLAQRKEEAEKYRVENEPAYITISRAVCENFGMTCISCNAIDYGADIVPDKEVEQNYNAGRMFLHISTNQGYYYIIVDDQEAVLVDGNTHSVIGSVILSQMNINNV